MNPRFLSVILILSLCSVSKTWAQEPVTSPPIPIETMFGNNQLYFQLVVKRKFTPNSKFSYFTVATFNTDYSNNDRIGNILMPVQISRSIGKKGFGIMAGGEMNSAIGFYPIIGPQFNYSSRKLLAVTVASFYINSGNDLKIFGLYEFKPSLSQNWNLYSRLQFIYNFSMETGDHNRSYVYLRAGLKRKQLAFGIGANLDQIGPAKIYRENFGPFLRWDFN